MVGKKKKDKLNPPPDGHIQEDLSQTSFISYWTLLGKLVSLFTFPLLIFTITLALRLNGNILWSYWYIFLPVFILLLASLLLSTSQRLSQPAPVQMRMAWLVCIICIGSFLVMLVLKLEGTTLGPWRYFYLPLYIIGLITFGCGFHQTFIFGCCNSDQNHKKYILSGTPVFCFGMVFLPAVILLSLKVGVDDIKVSMDWAIVFIPLFVTDVFCFCMGFFLLLFSFGGRKDALFSITQLVIFLAVIPISIVFKILLIIYLDGIMDFAVFYCFLPLIVLELLLLFCGISMATNTKAILHASEGYRQIPHQEQPEKTGIP